MTVDEYLDRHELIHDKYREMLKSSDPHIRELGSLFCDIDRRHLLFELQVSALRGLRA